jgi:hypothetical protein
MKLMIFRFRCRRINHKQKKGGAGMRKTFVLTAVFAFVMLFAVSAWAGEALIWGVRPGSNGMEIININPWTGVVGTTYAAPGVSSSSNTEIGLAGWSNALYYTNAQTANGTIYSINPTTGVMTSSYDVSGGWEIDGLGYWSGGANSYLYTSGCSSDDVHRYDATGGASPQYYWSNVNDPQSMAGDNGGRIFTYGSVTGAALGIYEIDPLNDVNASFWGASPSTSIVDMAFDGTYLYLSDTQGMLYIMLNGQVVDTTNLGYNLYALASTEGVPIGTPEPLSLLLVGAGLLGLGIVRKSL